MNFLKNKSFLRIIGILIFLLILTKLDIQKTQDILNNINIKYFIIGLLLFIPNILAKIYRWKKILDFQKINIKFKKILHPYISTYGLGIITPWKIGELTRISFLRNKKIPIGKASFGVFLDRIVDVIFFFIIGLIGMFFLFEFFKQYIMSVIIFSLIAILILLLITYKRRKTTALFLKIIPNRLKEKTYCTIKELWYEFKNIKKLFFLEILLITAISWLFFYLEIYLFAIALNIPLSLWQVIILVSVASIVNLMPITISGIGTRDATFIFLFSIFGFQNEQAIALSLLILIMWIINALVCMTFWWKKPIKLENNS
jgi:glycosyltransferase 2 family protein